MFHISTLVRGMAEVQKPRIVMVSARVCSIRAKMENDGNQTADRPVMSWGIGPGF